MGLWISFFWFGIAQARLVLYTFDEQCTIAERVVVAKVAEDRHWILGKGYAQLEVERTIKGETSSRLEYEYGDYFFFFREDETRLRIGGRYVMFLYRANSRFMSVGRHMGVYEIDGNGRIVHQDDELSLDEFIERVIGVLRNHGQKLAQ